MNSYGYKKECPKAAPYEKIYRDSAIENKGKGYRICALNQKGSV